MRKPTPDARVLQRAMSNLLHKTPKHTPGKSMADMAEDVESEPDMDESHTEVLHLHPHAAPHAVRSA